MNFKVNVATGCSVSKRDLLKEKNVFNVADFGVRPNNGAIENTKAINLAIQKVFEMGGGTLAFPAGDFKVYTIRLKSNVNLFLDKDTIVHAAGTEIKGNDEQRSDGGNYDEPEVNKFIGVQDHGHTYFANSLIYGVDIENVMIYGEGRLDGSIVEDGYRKYILRGHDPAEPLKRSENGHKGSWYGNKAIALVRCKNVVLSDFDIFLGGHFAIIAEGVKNLLIDKMVVDTIRDALDVDCCEDVTVRNSVFNSLTDDAIVMKASYGAGIFMPTKNVLIEDCTVSGYDAGSVLAKTYTANKLIATDRCGPTARVKLGTESTCGYDTVTVRRIKFERSRGFALEAVDCSDLSNIIFTDSVMDNVSSSPIFIRVGDRARFPVTGNSLEDFIDTHYNIRLDNQRWVLPNTGDYPLYEAKRYTPSYNRNQKVTVDGYSEFNIVNQDEPTVLNLVNYSFEGGKYYLKSFDKATHQYETDYSKEINPKDLPKYSNAVGGERIARAYNIEISNIKATNVDPRYPIIFMGLVDSKIKNVSINNIDITYRGGMTMEHAIEQRQLNTSWVYSQFETKQSEQTLPWLVNTFFSKNEGLLPRVSFSQEKNEWVSDPYNIPEMPDLYPEPSNWGILPAYGMYIRHAENLFMENIKFGYEVEDERPPLVLDDVKDFILKDFTADVSLKTSKVIAVKNNYKRHTNMEYVINEKYFTTDTENIILPDKISLKKVVVNAPSPATPQDKYYSMETVPVPHNGYSYKIPTEEYPLPLMVFKPYFIPVSPKTIWCGEKMELSVLFKDPATETNNKKNEFDNNIEFKMKHFLVGGSNRKLKVSADILPNGAIFDEATQVFSWTPKQNQIGVYKVRFFIIDKIVLDELEIKVEVKE